MKTIFDIIEKDTIFFDLETTGTIIQSDKIIQLVGIKYKMDRSTVSLSRYFNPEMDIPQEAFEKHGLSREFLKDYPTFASCAQEVYDFFNGCDIGGYNVVKFDMAFLYDELSRNGKNLKFINTNMLDSFMLQNKFEPRTLEASYQRMFGEPFENAHDAMSDILATIRIFEKQLELYKLDDKKASEISHIVRSTQMNEKVIDLSGFFRQGIDGQYYYEKGKHRNKLVKDELQYLYWLAHESNMETNVKDVAKMFLHGIEKGKI